MDEERLNHMYIEKTFFLEITNMPCMTRPQIYYSDNDKIKEY